MTGQRPTDMPELQGDSHWRHTMNEFSFHTKLDLTVLLGRVAKNSAELLEGMKEVPDSSIYYHTHRFLHQHHYLSPEPPNDFAYWTTEVINDALLGEKLSSVDIVQFERIADLRATFIEILEEHLQEAEKLRDCPTGEEFHFMASQTFAIPTPYAARSTREFADILQRVSINSLYFHIFDARLRLEHGENDFSRWFRDLGKQELADELARLDPYTYTLEGLRQRIIQLVKKHDSD
jgi:hypothetical protein